VRSAFERALGCHPIDELVLICGEKGVGGAVMGHLRGRPRILFASVVAGLVLQPSRVSMPRTRPLRACAEPDDGWTVSSTGLRYKDEVVGSGESPEAGAVVKVHYTGTLAADGSQFDSSIGRAPFAFKVGQGKVIAGWEEGIAGMRVGGKRKLNIPWDLAYGEDGSGSIPAKADLNFDCELLGIESGFAATVATFPGGLPNVALTAVLLLSFIPYFLPTEMMPDAWKVQ